MLLGRCLLAIAMLLCLPAAAQVCAIPGKDGPATALSGVVSTGRPSAASMAAAARARLNWARAITPQPRAASRWAASMAMRSCPAASPACRAATSWLRLSCDRVAPRQRSGSG